MMDPPIAPYSTIGTPAPNAVNKTWLTAEDQASFGKHWDGAFFSNAASDAIFEAVVAKTGNGNTNVLNLNKNEVRAQLLVFVVANPWMISHKENNKIPVTMIPYDFVLDKENLKTEEIEARFAHVKGTEVFNKGDQPASANLVDDFRTRLRKLRHFLVDLSFSRLTLYFDANAWTVNKGQFPDLKKLDDYLRAYLMNGHCNKMRGMVKALTHDIWSKQCAMRIEKEIMDQLGLKYSDKLVSGAVVKRASGNICSLVQRTKQTRFCSRFREIGKKHCEVIYTRNPVKRTKAGTEFWPQNVIKVLKVTTASHGFAGYLGILSGHPMLLDTTVIGPPGEEDESSEQSLWRLLTKAAARDGSVTVSSLLERLAETGKKQHPREISVGPGVSVVSKSSMSSLSCRSYGSPESLANQVSTVCFN